MAFKTDLHNVDWNLINHSRETNSKYDTFLKIFSEFYGKDFPLKDFQMKAKGVQLPWISKRLKNRPSKNKNCILNF